MIKYVKLIVRFDGASPFYVIMAAKKLSIQKRKTLKDQHSFSRSVNRSVSLIILYLSVRRTDEQYCDALPVYEF